MNYLKTETNQQINKSKTYFVNIMDGDEAYININKYKYLLDQDEYINIRKNIYVGDLKNSFDWLININ